MVRPTKRIVRAAQPVPEVEAPSARGFSKGKYSVVPKRAAPPPSAVDREQHGSAYSRRTSTYDSRIEPGIEDAPGRRLRTTGKGRYMAIPSGEIVPASPSGTPTPHVPAVSKYDARSAPGVGAPITQPEPQPAAVAPEAPVAEPPPGDTKPIEIVVDLREDEKGFEATYWQRESAEPPGLSRKR